MPNIIPSTLSKKPPCPGKKFPVSFTFAFRFKYEKNKSPNWQKIDVTVATIKILKSVLNAIKKNIKYNVKDEKIIDPRAPEIVLLGLIFVNFGPLNILPNIKPPISDATQQNKSENISILIWKKIEKIKNKLQKEKTYKINIIFVKNFDKLFFKILLIRNENSIKEKIPTIIKVNSKIGLYLIIKKDKNIKKKDVWILLLRFLDII